MDPQLIINGLKEAYEKAGYLGLAVAVLMVGVNVYKLPLVQQFVPAKLKWDNLSLWPQRALVFASALGGLALTAVIGGLGWPAALMAAAPVAIGAALAHRLGKVLGSTLDGVMVKIDLDYEPGKVRKMVAVALPIDKDKVGP